MIEEDDKTSTFEKGLIKISQAHAISTEEEEAGEARKLRYVLSIRSIPCNLILNTQKS
jgi:hypothetical protein